MVPPLLKTFGPEMLELLVAHPEQLRLADTIADLLENLRTFSTPRDYHEFQGWLLQELLDVEERRSAVSRAVLRGHRCYGHDAEPSPARP